MIFSSWPERPFRNETYKRQCRIKCWLSSIASPQLQIGLKQSKLCRNLCSFKLLNSIRSFVNREMPIISRTLKMGFLGGLVVAKSFLLDRTYDKLCPHNPNKVLHTVCIFWQRTSLDTYLERFLIIPIPLLAFIIASRILHWKLSLEPIIRPKCLCSRLKQLWACLLFFSE